MSNYDQPMLPIGDDAPAPTRPAPQDHLPKKNALKTFEFRGTQYTVPGNALDDIEVMEALEDEKYITVIKKTIGADQWAKFKAASRTSDGRIPLTDSGFEEFIDTLMKAVDPTVAS